MSKEVMNNTEIEEVAGVEAAADATATEATKEVLASESTNLNSKLPYIVELSKEYDLDGKKIKEVDLSGLEDLTTLDAEYIDRVMNKLNYHPTNKYKDITYTKHIAMRVTNLPIEFFNGLKWKDMYAITARITVHFLF